MTEVPAFDPEKFKSATREQWQQSAAGWNDKTPQIRSWLLDSTAAMLEMAAIRQGHRVLDVAAGAGDQTLDIANRVGPEGEVVASDLSPAILEYARANAHRAGHRNIQFEVVDGEALNFEPESFDAAVCRLGLMFFPDPARGLGEMFRALKPGGHACTMVFSSPERNPCIAILVSTALKHAGLPPRDPYAPGGLLSLGKPNLIDELFRGAGFREVATTKVAAPFKLSSARDYLDFIRTSAGPILQILGRLDESRRQAAWDEVEERLSTFNVTGGWEGPNELLLTAGSK